MITDQQAAGLCMGLYAYRDQPVVEWAHFDAGLDDGVCWALSTADDVDVIVLRGSETTPDWVHDFETWADELVGYPSLGQVHHGFSVGLPKMWEEAKTMIGPKVIVTGHSLGAGRACILAGMMAQDERPPLRRICFGEPRSGYRPLAHALATIAAGSYRNFGTGGHDVVTGVPFSIPGFPFEHPSALKDVCAPPDVGLVQSWKIFAWHHMSLYAQALGATAAA